MTANITQKTYPLVKGDYQLFFESVPGSEVLGIYLLKEGQAQPIKLGDYSVDQSLWLTKNESIELSAPLLEEILTITKGVAYARACEYSKVSRLTR